ncbi:unnamed protein product [Paramecium sonneborni]|uniref:Uncharacterized protein n=1 Tax=Paramecium sonneborni TaxID=65129 RepID=A0A8S1QUZ2_9CILI|nr:unnamed protein product [Paramecium sonneborni]
MKISKYFVLVQPNLKATLSKREKLRVNLIRILFRRNSFSNRKMKQKNSSKMFSPVKIKRLLNNQRYNTKFLNKCWVINQKLSLKKHIIQIKVSNNNYKSQQELIYFYSFFMEGKLL